MRQGALVSDYMFAKDRLFAKLNLQGDEWDVYEQLHHALAEQIPSADLIVYLQADTDVLMGRIAQRDRPYERDMDRRYIEAVRQMYDDYFYNLQATMGLIIDTNELNFVARPADFQSVLERIASVLKEGTFQQPLPQLEVRVPDETVQVEKGRQIADYQRLHVELDRTKGFKTDLYFNYLCLSEEMGELGRELARLWKTQDLWVAKGEPSAASLELALRERRSAVESELADCMAYLLKLANYTGIDLESAYLKKMDENLTRHWPG